MKHLSINTWRADMKTLKLLHIQRTTPGFFLASGGWHMVVKNFSEKTDSKLGAAVAACIKYCGGLSELKYNFTLAKGSNGYQAIYNDTWKPLRVTGKFENRLLTIEINKFAAPAARTTAHKLYLGTPSFEIFSKWFCSHFPNSIWCKIVTGEAAVLSGNPSKNGAPNEKELEARNANKKALPFGGYRSGQRKNLNPGSRVRENCGTPPPQMLQHKI